MAGRPRPQFGRRARQLVWCAWIKSEESPHLVLPAVTTRTFGLPNASPIVWDFVRWSARSRLSAAVSLPLSRRHWYVATIVFVRQREMSTGRRR